MLTYNSFVRKKESVSAEAFRTYWTDQRYEMERPMLKKLGVRKYTICETQHDDPATAALQELYGTPAEGCYDYVNHLDINDLEDFKKGMQNPDVLATISAVANEDAEYLDLGECDVWFTVDVPQILPREEYAATCNNSYLKMYYFARSLPHLSVREAQLEWLSNHGAMARQFREVLPFDQYLQCHLLGSNLMKKVKELMGFGGDSQHRFGFAELWFDRRSLPGFAGPDIEHIVGMLLEDIALLVDLPASRVFASKEIVKHSEAIITRPLPKLTGGD